MERVTGLEPAASSLARKRSSQMSYTRIWERFSFLKLHFNNFQIFFFFFLFYTRCSDHIRWTNND